MTTQFAFRTSQITTVRPPDDNFAGSHSTLILNTAPAVDPVSDAINNVRFACTGFAGHGNFETVMFTLLTRHTFTFQPQIAGRVTTAHTHFMPQGGSSLTARRPTFFLDGPGVVTVNMFMSMRLRVLAANGVEVPNSRLFRRAVNIFSVTARATSVSVSSERTIDAELLEFTRSRSSTTIVGVTDTVEVQARYTVQALAFDGAEFFLDFASVGAGFGDPGDGLNSPFAVINIAEL
jgi:hypothetical protein